MFCVACFAVAKSRLRALETALRRNGEASTAAISEDPKKWGTDWQRELAREMRQGERDEDADEASPAEARAARESRRMRAAVRFSEHMMSIEVDNRCAPAHRPPKQPPDVYTDEPEVNKHKLDGFD